MRRPAAPRSDDRGTTLVELLVTMIIATIVLAGTVAMSSGLQRTAAQIFARQDQTDIGRQAGDRLTTTLRSAADTGPTGQLAMTCNSGCPGGAFLAASGSMTTFFASLNNTGATGPLKVTYTVPTTGSQTGHLLETAQTATIVVAGSTYKFCDTSVGTCAATTGTTRDLTPGTTIATTPPAFRYFDKDGTELAPGGGALSAAQLGQVMSVELTLSVQRQGATTTDPTTYVARIDLPNQQAVLAPR